MSWTMKVITKPDNLNKNMDYLNRFNLKPFNMRNITLLNFNQNEKRPSFKSTIMTTSKIRDEYLIASPSKSMNLLRKLVQTQINKEIDSLLQKYSAMFFLPAIENISKNIDDQNLFEFNIEQIFHDILDDAKRMYTDEKEDLDNKNEYSQLRTRGRPSKYKEKVKAQKFKAKLKQKKKIKISTNTDDTKNEKDPVFRNTVKWNPSRLSSETLFVLGSKANKALGFGSARGRLYTKHADLFRYIGDQEDKEWLHKNQLMAPTGGKAYLLVKEDILQLMNSKEYQGIPGVNLSDMGEGFTVPQNMIDKMIAVMQNMRNNIINRSKIDFKTQNLACNEDSSSSQTTSISELPILDSDLLTSLNESTDHSDNY